MKYLRKFATEAEVDVDALPNVVLVAESGAVKYSVPIYENGVYIQHIDGRLYTKGEWSVKGFANEVANGVAVIADECSFVMAKTRAAYTKWGGYGKIISNIVTTDILAEAETDYLGKSNTEQILEQLKGYTDSKGIKGSPAAEACVDYTFPNGQQGYLPSLGEWVIAEKKKATIDSILAYLGGAAIESAGYIVTSTQYSSERYWTARWDGGASNTNSKSPTYATEEVRPFAPLIL